MALLDENITLEADESQACKNEDAELKKNEVKSNLKPTKLLKGPKDPSKDDKGEASKSDAGGANVKAADIKSHIMAGTSSGTASSRLDEVPFVLASRRTVEEHVRRKVILKGLKEDEEGDEWVVV